MCVCVCVSLSLSLSVYRYLFVSVSTFGCVCLYLPVCVSVALCVCVCVWVSVCLSVSASVCLSKCPCLSLALSLSLCVCVRMCVRACVRCPSGLSLNKRQPEACSAKSYNKTSYPTLFLFSSYEVYYSRAIYDPNHPGTTPQAIIHLHNLRYKDTIFKRYLIYIYKFYLQHNQ